MLSQGDRKRKRHQTAEELGRHGELPSQPLALGTPSHVAVDRAALLWGQARDSGGDQLGQPWTVVTALGHQQVADGVAERFSRSVEQHGGVAGGHPEHLGDLRGGKVSAQGEV
jgi:hypothetical protein